MLIFFGPCFFMWVFFVCVCVCVFPSPLLVECLSQSRSPSACLAMPCLRRCQKPPLLPKKVLLYASNLLLRPEERETFCVSPIYVAGRLPFVSQWHYAPSIFVSQWYSGKRLEPWSHQNVPQSPCASEATPLPRIEVSLEAALMQGAEAGKQQASLLSSTDSFHLALAVHHCDDHSYDLLCLYLSENRQSSEVSVLNPKLTPKLTPKRRGIPRWRGTQEPF